MPVTVIANAANRGFPAAINQGLQAARGEYLVLLNNDVVVTDAWLDQLIALATAKTGREVGFTAKNAKSAKKSEKIEEIDLNSVAEFRDIEPDLGERAWASLPASRGFLGGSDGASPSLALPRSRKAPRTTNGRVGGLTTSDRRTGKSA